MTYYVPGTEEKDLKKVIMSLQQVHESTAGQVAGPASSTDNAAARFDGTGGLTVQNSALIIADTTAALSRSGGGGIAIQGSNTNAAAATGDVGEIIAAGPTSSGTLTTATATNINSIPLTAGHWRIIAGFTAGGTGGPSVTEIFVSVNTVSATGNTTPGQCFRIRGFTLTDPLFYSQAANFTVYLSGAATYYLNTTCQYTGGTFAVTGTIEAERVH